MLPCLATVLPEGAFRPSELCRLADRVAGNEVFMHDLESWRIALENIGDAVIISDDSGNVTYLNPMAETLTGWKAAEARGTPTHEIVRVINPKTGKEVERLAEQVLREQRPVGVKSHGLLRRRDGAETPVDESASPILNENRQVVGVVLVLRDASISRGASLLHERMAAIVESSDDMIVSKNLDGIITSWNRGAEKVLGYRAEEVIGKHVSMLMPPEAVEDTEKILGKVRLGEKVDHYVTKRRHKDGRIVDVSLTVSPIRDAEGVIVGASKVGRDITAIRHADILRDRLAAIVESSDDIIVSKDLNGVITSWNRGAERVLGYAAEEVVGKHISLIMPPELVEDMYKILAKVRRGEKVEHYETRRRRKDGRIIEVSLTVSPVRDGNGQIVGASKIGRDITHQKQLEAERREADRRKDEFLAMLAHELRNPLASISNAVQLFGRLETEADLEWAKEIVHRQVKHLSRLIDDLLDVSRITRGKISLRKVVVDLSPIVSSAVEAVRPLIEERKHQLTVSLAPGALRLIADPVRLEQILVNLLTNAAKYTEAGGKILLEGSCEEGRILIRVRDTGIGIPAELIPNLFELFVQGDRSIARSEGGLGIGLTLVKRLAELHDGDVTAESEGLGKGSQFTLSFPAVSPASDKRAPSPGAASLPRVARQQSRILVVDDNVDTAGGLTKLLRLLGHHVEMTHDGETAIETALTFKPEIVLLDIGLPGINGYEVARRLRQEPECKTALIIAVSGYGQEEDRRRSHEAGFDHHLTKPVDFDSLISLLN